MSKENKMLILHNTKTRYMNSILKHGILRHKPQLSKFDDIMRKDYGTEYNKEKGIVFGYISGYNDQKYFQDQAYWNMWGKPRNDALDMDYDEFCRMQEKGPSVFSNMTYKDESYIALLLDLPYNPLYENYLHVQTNDMDMNPVWENMDERYEHNDMPLALINFDIKPDCIKGVIGTTNAIINKKGGIDMYTTMKFRRIE